MLFRRISFHNFGLLSGNQTVDLSTNSTGAGGACIVLIGGQNGAGKTTILEGIRVCLYGRLAFDEPMSSNAYQEYLLSRIHRAKGSRPSPTESSVLLEFELTASGAIDIFQIQRSWRTVSIDSTKVQESVLILKNGNILDDIEVDYWQEFIQSLVPSGLSQLFFFDGEKIQKLADDATDAESLSSAVRALLGLEVVERLQADLGIIISRDLKKVVGSKEQDNIAAAKEQKSAIDHSLNVAQQERAGLANEIAKVQRDLERAERDLMQAGGGLYEDREKLVRKRSEIETNLEQVERRLREICEGEFPFTLCQDLCRKLQVQLLSEAELIKWESSQEHVRAFANLVINRLAAIAKNDRNVELAVRSALDEAAVPPKEIAGVKVLHGLSLNAHLEIDAWLKVALEQLPGEVRALNRRYESLQRELTKTQRALSQVPDQETLKPLMESLFSLQQRLAELTTLDKELESEVAEKERLLNLADRAVEKASDKAKESENLDRRMAFAVKTQEALKEFQARLTDAKLRKLEREFVDTFNFLTRKLEVSQASIKIEDFSVSLYDEDGKQFQKSELSAGEKQIYAIAMLWSLAKISGRNLPVVIDTPLGRLDSVHRAHLLERYFPNAAHQVIILSTDTEVDQASFHQLEPNVVRSYRLRHDQAERMTQVEEGYFWKEAACV